MTERTPIHQCEQDAMTRLLTDIVNLGAIAAPDPYAGPPGQLATNKRADAWRKVANARLAERTRLNGGYSKGSH